MSRTTLLGRAGATLVASAVTVSLILAGGTAQAASADRGAGWLAGQLDNGVMVNGGFADYGLSIDTAFALKAVGGHGSDVRQIRDAVEQNVGDYIAGDSFGDPGSTYAGATAKSLVLAQSTGTDPRDFGGVDLIKRLNGVVHTSGPAKGRIVDVSTFGDFANTLGQILADILIFAMRPLYPSYAEQPDRLLGLSPLEDQRLAGLVMMVEQLLTLGTFVALLLVAQHRKLFGSAEDERRVAA